MVTSVALCSEGDRSFADISRFLHKDGVYIEDGRPIKPDSEE